MEYPIWKKCVRAIVGEVVGNFMAQKESATEAGALEASRRSLARVLDLLERMSANSEEPWIFEAMAYFYQWNQDGRPVGSKRTEV